MTTAMKGTMAPARSAPGRRQGRQRRLHPVIAAALVAVAVAAGCVGGASAWREHASARHAQLAQWQTLAGSAADAQALAALQKRRRRARSRPRPRSVRRCGQAGMRRRMPKAGTG
ncbi:hypothetical protein [Cupriavidus sp. D39]|uniref:hypothetical protein n=1 Tax=Cupriavidus sp. D39 TaxID=2997877 RepID=UPI00226EF034|nr:hypothetical protein [Cupriavidus sp. D39]MCY0857972.1 hypothetical protein [Cupriavidus sp. D39]